MSYATQEPQIQKRMPFRGSCLIEKWQKMEIDFLDKCYAKIARWHNLLYSLPTWLMQLNMEIVLFPYLRNRVCDWRGSSEHTNAGCFFSSPFIGESLASALVASSFLFGVTSDGLPPFDIVSNRRLLTSC